MQKGKRRADIKITLKNEGEDAYKEDVYGPSITFSRTITDSGQSSVKILDYQNQEIKKNKEAREEGKRILDNFRITTDNPIVILQQEEAKELLRVECPAALYEFFQKATLLKQCLEQYTDATKDLKKCEEKTREKKAGLEEMGLRLQKQKKKVEEIQKSQDRDKEEKQLEHEYLYAQLLDQREKQEEARDKISLREEKKKKVGKKIRVTLAHFYQLIFQAKEKLLNMNAEKSAFDKEMAEVQVQIEAEKKKSEEEENKMMNSQVCTERQKHSRDR